MKLSLGVCHQYLSFFGLTEAYISITYTVHRVILDLRDSLNLANMIVGDPSLGWLPMHMDILGRVVGVLEKDSPSWGESYARCMSCAQDLSRAMEAIVYSETDGPTSDSDRAVWEENVGGWHDQLTQKLWTNDSERDEFVDQIIDQFLVRKAVCLYLLVRNAVCAYLCG